MDDVITELLSFARGLAAQAAAGEEIEVACARSSRTSVRAYGGEIEAFTAADTGGLGIRVVSGGRQGFASAGSLDPDIAAETLIEARDNVAFAESDEHVALAHPDGVEPVVHDLWRDDVLATPPEVKIELALELERMVRAGDPRVTGVRTAAYSDGAARSVIVSSTGLEATNRATSASVGVTALARDGDETQIGGGSSFGRTPSDIDLDEAAADAVTRATRLLGATKPASAAVTLVLEPRLAATLLGMVGGMLTGERVLKGRTPFADRKDAMIAHPSVHLVDDPTDPASFGAAPTDGEGLACRRNVLIADGVLRGFLHNTYTGNRSGTGSTGSAMRGVQSTPGVGARALALAPGTGDLDSIIGGVDLGLLVSSMSGLHSGVNAVSGDFSVGVDGIMIRGGEQAEPVREATVASTIQRLLTDMSAIGADIEHRPGGTSAVTVAIDGVALSGM